jgi:hypothetical protein
MLSKRSCPEMTGVRRSALVGLVAAVAFCLLPAAAPAQTRAPEPVVSLSVKDKPLGEVLAEITRTTGTDFVVEPAWQAIKVTAYAENAPLSVALKRVLSGLNHAIVYLPQNRIKILIYEASAPNPASDPQPALTPMGPRPGRIPPPSPPVQQYVDPMQNAPPDQGGVPPVIPPTEEEPPPPQ